MEEDIKILEELKQEYSKGLDRLNDKDLSSCMAEIYKYRKKQVQAIENLIKSNKEKDTEINKLNKIIDNMADFIFTYDCCSHFAENRVKCKMKGFETTLGNCKNNCIKDYFRKKVENE